MRPEAGIARHEGLREGLTEGCAGAAGGGTALSLGHADCSSPRPRGLPPIPSAQRSRVLEGTRSQQNKEDFYGVQPCRSVHQPRVWFGGGGLVSPRCAPFRNIFQHCSSDAAANSPVTFGDDRAVTQLCFFTVVKKSYSKQNSQALMKLVSGGSFLVRVLIGILLKGMC